MEVIVRGIKLALDEGEGLLPQRVSRVLGLAENEVRSCRIVRKSLDARRRREPLFVYTLAVSLSGEIRFPSDCPAGISIKTAGKPLPSFPASLHPRKSRLAGKTRRPIVVGSGPAGLFAALVLAKSGLCPLLLERGKPVEERVGDVEDFWRRGRLNPESNAQFGEGGAGTFSDGKLTSRTDHPYSAWVKKILVECGAPESISIDARAHIGTDRLRKILPVFRQMLLDSGCEVRFGSRVTDFIFSRGRFSAVVVNDQQEIEAGGLILAAGQSAGDIYERLAHFGFVLAAKPFALGLRVEHPQELINRIQYGKWSGRKELPPAEYFLKSTPGAFGRHVYSFCMCPGGRIIGTGSASGEVATNGMSDYLRDGSRANSALVVNVRADDIPGADPLRGLSFRRHWERRAFILGGGDYSAPGQRLGEFMKDLSPSLGDNTVWPKARPAALKETLPPFVYEALKGGIRAFSRQMPGFETEEANLFGVETRTSSPVRILRGDDGCCLARPGIYPCGEGAGYAGGIISSAIDGINGALKLSQARPAR